MLKKMQGCFVAHVYISGLISPTTITKIARVSDFHMEPGTRAKIGF
jgi:hypothetical protein